MENFPIFPIRKVPENVLKTLLWGAETIRKKYWVVFEIFLKSMFFSAFSEKYVRNFFIGKISDFSNSETSKRCLQKSSVGTRNTQKKILSSFWDIPKNDVFSAFQNGTSVLPSINIKLFSVGGRNYQNIKQKENQRGPLGDHLKDDPASGDKKIFFIIYHWSQKTIEFWQKSRSILLEARKAKKSCCISVLPFKGN